MLFRTWNGFILEIHPKNTILSILAFNFSSTVFQSGPNEEKKQNKIDFSIANQNHNKQPTASFQLPRYSIENYNFNSSSYAKFR